MAGKGLIAAVVGGLFILTGGAWLYFSVQGGGERVAACRQSEAVAASLEPLAVMDVAAFVPHAESSRQLPEISFKNEAGEVMSLADFRGRTVLLNLWATWCAPCREEMPEFDALEADLGGENFAIVPLSLDSGDDRKPKAFYQEVGLWNLGFYHEGTMAAFNTLKGTGLVVGLPTTILIDENGCTLGHMSGPAPWAGPSARALVEGAIGR